MEICVLCQNPTAPRDPFCSSCGHARIVESLRAAPKERPPWFEKVVMGVVALIGLWLIVTVAVAFLREAKALRRARAALEAHDAHTAFEWVSPFVASHQKNVEARYLAGASAIMTNQPKEATKHYLALVGMGKAKKVVERVERLEAVLHNQIPVNAALLPCGQSGYAEFYELHKSLGEKFRETLVRSGASVARKCVGSNQRSIANEPGYWLINEQKLDPEFVVSSLYLDPLRPALENGQYVLAGNLAVQGTLLWPEATPKVDEIFKVVRHKAAQTAEEMLGLCNGLNSESRRGRSICYPESAPETVASYRDAWGNPVYYYPFSKNERTQCYTGFQLISLGADARQTPGDTSTAAMDITCVYQWGRGRIKSPDEFWLSP